MVSRFEDSYGDVRLDHGGFWEEIGLRDAAQVDVMHRMNIVALVNAVQCDPFLYCRSLTLRRKGGSAFRLCPWGS